MTSKCIQCRKVAQIFKSCPKGAVRGTAGTRMRAGTVDWCESCWLENVRFNEECRTRDAAKNQAILDNFSKVR